MIYLVDTNVLLHFADRLDPQHPTVRRAVRKLPLASDDLRATPQNFVEFWVVATRPLANNGLGLSPPDVEQLLRIVESEFPLLPDSAGIYPEWRRLVVAFGVSGRQAHDGRLVALMKVHGVTHILTLNKVDFARYAQEGIVAVDPATV